MIPRLFAAVCLMLLPAVAHAHLLPKQNATMRVIDTSAFFVIAVPASALKGVDSDGNGLLSLSEIGAHQDEIKRQFLAGFEVRDGEIAGKDALTWVTSPITDGEQRDADYVIVLHKIDFERKPVHPTIAINLFGTRAGEQQFSIKATRDEAVEVAVLERGSSSHSFFRGRLAIFTDFVRIGFEHIWTGYDHLLFLLTIVIIGAGWRHWLLVVTSFTVAHSITLTLSALDILRISSGIVEPGIALSIVGMALLNLRAFAKGYHAPHWSRIAIVFACGLLHGFGFASALSSFALNANNRLATLAGFNIGIEIAQFLFVAGAVALVWLTGRFAHAQLASRVPQVASGVALLLGCYFFVQQIGLV